MTAVLVLLSVAVALLLLVLAVQLAGVGRRAPATLLQQQLIEVRNRLDALVTTQREVPQVMAEGSARQERSLAEVREQLVRLGEAASRVERLAHGVAEIEELLKVPRLRGTLGEVWLAELLSQVLPADAYRLQHGFRSGERVDAAIQVGDRFVPVDSKFPLEACQRMLGADGEEAAKERRTFHRAVRDHIDDIAQKYIRPGEGTYDFALMYIPAENVYYEAMVREAGSGVESGVAGYALDRKVIPVSPNTFYAYLSAIAHGLRGLQVERRAREILEGLGALAQQLHQVERSHELVGKHLGNAAKQFDESERQLRSIRERIESLAWR
jgi:DNA recombination protein RmuC